MFFAKICLMFETVAIPVWTLWLAGGLALIGLLDRILLPSVRWFFQRRFNKAVNNLNDRLSLRIQPFKRTKRRVMIDRLAHDPIVMEAIDDYTKDEGAPYEVAAEMAHRYAREIVPSFSAFTYFAFGIRLARWLSRLLFRVRLGYVDRKALDGLDADATVVFVMNHRSNMDYILVTYLAAGRSALSYAVGEWARIWPLKQLIRSTGAYFIRRKSRNVLYRRVLARYVQMATEGGVTQAIFPEGGLSRDGYLQPVKLGLLNYIVSGFDASGERDVVFVPVGLNYDRVLEDRVLTATGKGEKRAGIFLKVWGFLRFVGRNTVLRLMGRFRKFGYASVSFGAPISLLEFLEDKADKDHEARTVALGKRLLHELGQVVPMLPVPLISLAFCKSPGKSLDVAEIVANTLVMRDRLVANGGLNLFPDSFHEKSIEHGLKQMVMRKLLIEQDGQYVANPKEPKLLAYYANSIAHLQGKDSGKLGGDSV